MWCDVVWYYAMWCYVMSCNAVMLYDVYASIMKMWLTDF